MRAVEPHKTLICQSKNDPLKRAQRHQQITLSPRGAKAEGQALVSI